MSDVTAAPLPEDLGAQLSEEELAQTAGQSRRAQTLGAVIGGLGVVLIFLAVQLDADRRAFAFEPPPEPLRWEFNPRLLVAAIGAVWVLAGLVSVLPLVPLKPLRSWSGPREVPVGRIATILQIVAGLLALPLVLAIGLSLSNQPQTNVTVLVQQSLILATPLVLGAMTGLWCERSGIVNIGIEGMLLASAGVGYMAYAVAGSAAGGGWLWFGVAIAVATGGLAAALHAVLSIRFRINQIVSGVVINLVALGLTGFLRSQVIVPTGFAKGRTTTDIGIPLLSHLPIVGDTLFTGGPLHFTMYAVVFLTWLVLYRTPWGLRVRACGEHPHAAETVGVDVVAMRYQAVIVGGLIAGLGGAWFSMESQSGFEDNMTNAAGFIALAALIVGKWTPWGAFAGALLFGFTRALGSRLQVLQVSIGDFGIPSEFFQGLPFIVTLVVVAGALGRAIAPAAAGRPYAPSK